VAHRLASIAMMPDDMTATPAARQRTPQDWIEGLPDRIATRQAAT
jgi:hypothetical protein